MESDKKLHASSRSLKAGEEAALDAFFRSYLQSEECRADPQHLELTSIGSGDDVSSVKAILDGAFTGPGAKQSLMAFFVGHCGVLGAHSERYGKTFVMLFQDGHLIGHTEKGPTAMSQAVDLDHDGVSEVLESRADYGSGTLFVEAAAWSYLAGEPRTLASFELSLQSCNLGGEHYESTLLTRWDQRRNAICFLARRREIGCPAAP
jgi:hypothetical protein